MTAVAPVQTQTNMTTPLVALITAGSAGLGATTARLFAKNGIRVVINYSSNVERAQNLVTELHQLSTLPTTPGRTDFVAIKADLSRRDDIGRLVDESVAAMARLDIVFSNGGWTRLRNINDLDDNVDEDDWDRCFNMNVKSHLWLMHAAKKHLDETEGAFITTSSFAGVKVSGSSLVSRTLSPLLIFSPEGLCQFTS
jgi:NAD(P)-dependent dehydrogenase (short-subunit alcohol dehydrogenase family)